MFLNTIKAGKWSSEVITLFASIFFALFCNHTFWKQLLQAKVYHPFHTCYLLFWVVLAVVSINWFVLLLVINRWTFKWLMIIILMINSVSVYFTDVFGIYIDPTMIVNVFETDIHESMEFLKIRLLLYIFFLGVLPSIFVLCSSIYKRSLMSYWIGRLSTICASLGVFFISIWSVYSELSTIHHEHKGILYLLSPLNWISSTITAYSPYFSSPNQSKEMIGKHAYMVPSNSNRPKAIVFIVGETVRASNWGLNNYYRQTTPLLARQKLINFNKVTSCGTSTAISLPCMFSAYGQHLYNRSKIHNSESILHLLSHLHIDVLWRDNQSGCKEVCDGLPFERLELPSLCQEGRCYDEILAHEIKHKIKTKRINQLIVLHMLGNHGPAYYLRYPESFKKWNPVCLTSDLASCSQKSVINTYDNAILYTDFILNKIINELKSMDDYDTALIYVSDHGESLGEHHIYLHGLPYFMAPEEQKSVPFIMWMSKSFLKSENLDYRCLKNKEKTPISHDYIFSTLLSIFNIQAEEYNEHYDLLAGCIA